VALNRSPYLSDLPFDALNISAGAV